MNAPNLTLYELAGADPRLRFSPHCWKTRMALAHKGLDSQRIAWRFSDKPRIAFSGQGAVPLLVDGEQPISDSWRIALHLERAYPERPSLFGGEAALALAGFVNRWADGALLPAIAPLILLEVYGQLDSADREYFRSTREAHFGASLETLGQPRERHLGQLHQGTRTVTPGAQKPAVPRRGARGLRRLLRVRHVHVGPLHPPRGSAGGERAAVRLARAPARRLRRTGPHGPPGHFPSAWSRRCPVNPN